MYVTGRTYGGSFREHGNEEVTGGWTILHMRDYIICTLVKYCQVVGLFRNNLWPCVLCLNFLPQIQWYWIPPKNCYHLPD